MASGKPMLDDVELEHVQKIEAEDEEVLAEHGVPALEGDFLQDLGRRVTRLTLIGVMSGTEAGEQLNTLRLKFRNAEPVSFVSDIATATTVDKVLIEEFGVRELAGKPARYEYQVTLREFLPPPSPVVEDPPPPPPPQPEEPEPVDDVTTGTLVVEVNVEGQPDFDFSKVTVTVDGTKDDGSTLSPLTLTNRTDNVWTEENMVLGQFTVRAVVTEDPAMSGSAAAAIRSLQTTQAQINLQPGAIIATTFVVHFRFDNAFIEPCMREVLDQVARHAADNSGEKLLIVGHTDKTGDDPPVVPLYNQSLSERRARSVFAYLNFANDQAGSEAEWKELRQPGTGRRKIRDNWGTRQYQYMLQSLGFYPGQVDGDHGPLTDDAVRTFRAAKGLPVGTTVNDDVWEALIHDYLAETSHTVPDAQFLRNAKDACNGGTLKWLGCGEEDPLPLPQPPTREAHRPYRRAEMLFVNATQLACEVPQPDTFDLPSPGAVNSTWCLGPGNASRHCCFATRNCPSASPGQWCITPFETGSFVVRGRILFENGTPAANQNYVLIAPDGEFMDGEAISGARRGDGNFGRTRADGTFEYPGNPKGPGVYTMEIQSAVIARLDGQPQSAARGNVVCKRMDGSSDFNVVIRNVNTLVNPVINLASSVVVVKKSYTTPPRQQVTLTTDGPFFRTGTVTRAGAAIKFFDAAVDGNEITFNGTDNVFSGTRLSAGVQLFAQGDTASAALDDVVLTLTLTPGATPIGPAATATMTSVDLSMDIFMTRTAAGVDPAPFPQPPDPAPAPGTGTDKWFGGRFVHQQDPGSHHGRAMIVIRVQPTAFASDLTLRQIAVAADTPGALDNKVQVFDNEIPGARQTPPVAEAAKANPHVFNAGTVPAAGLRLFVEGANVSAALRDTGFQLGINGGELDGDRVRATVVRFSNLVAQIPSTPANTNRLANSPVPNSPFPRVAHAAQTPSDFDDDFVVNVPAVLVQGSLPAGTRIRLSVNVVPAGVPVRWSRQRDIRLAVGDHPDVIGASPNPLPALVQDPANALQATLELDAVGSFHVRPFVDCNGTNDFEHRDPISRAVIDLEPFIIMNFVMIRVGGSIGVGAGATASTNNSVAPPGNVAVIPAAPTSASGVALRTGNFAAPATAGVNNNATIVVIGGGNNGRRGLNQLFAGWINDVTAMDIVAEYRDPATGDIHTHVAVFASNTPGNPNLGVTGVFIRVGTVLPPSATLASSTAGPNIVDFPILDTSNFGNEGQGGNTAVGTGEQFGGVPVGPGPPPPPAGGPHQGIVRTPLAVGETWQIQQWDSPGFPGLPAHFTFPGTLRSFRDILDFRCDLCFWTNISGVPAPSPGPITGGVIPDTACSLYSTVQTDTWRIRFRVDFNPATGIGAFTTPASLAITRDPNPLRLAQPVQGSGLEVRFPIVLRLVAINAQA